MDYVPALALLCDLLVPLSNRFQLLYYAQVPKITYIRIGTSGGLGLEPGTVVVTTEAINGELEACLKMPILGKLHSRETKFDQELVRDIIEQAAHFTNDALPITTVSGKTIAG